MVVVVVLVTVVVMDVGDGDVDAAVDVDVAPVQQNSETPVFICFPTYHDENHMCLNGLSVSGTQAIEACGIYKFVMAGLGWRRPRFRMFQVKAH